MEILISVALASVTGGLLGILGYKIFRFKRQRTFLNFFIPLFTFCLTLLILKSPFKIDLFAYFDRRYYVENVMEKKFKSLMSDPRLQIEGKQEREKAWEYAYQLSKEGIKHLELSDLMAWNDYRIKMAENHRGFCVGILKGNLNLGVVIEALSQLHYDDELEEIANLVLKAAKRKLNDEGDPHIEIKEFQEGIKEITLALDEKDQENFALTMYEPKMKSDEDLCWASLKLLKGIKNLPDKRKEVVLKSLSGS